MGRTPRPLPQVRRIALYSHDAMGIGHVRRNLLVAQALRPGGSDGDGVRDGQNSTLLITGVYEAGAFDMPAGVDCLTLPAMRKQEDGSYQPRRLAMAATEVLGLRSAVILAALVQFDPDLVIVDKVPLGVGRELEPALRWIKKAGRARCVLGMRDILDQPAAVRHDWQRDGGEEAVREFYDAVWVYGTPHVYDLVREYRFAPEVAAKVRYTGYLDRRVAPGEGPDAQPWDPTAALNLPPGPVVLCTVGGGEDGASLAETFTRATLPDGASGVLLTGPFMPRQIRRRLQREAESRPHLRVLEFCTAPHELLARAERVVAMGGYNTVSEILSYDKPALIAPRVKPRQEQLIRAERLRDLGLVDMLYPDEVTPAAVSRWLASDLTPRPPARDRIDMNGIARLPELLGQLFAQDAGAPRPSPVPAAPPSAGSKAAGGGVTRVGA